MLTYSIFIAILGLIILYFTYLKNIPLVNDIKNIPMNQISVIYDKNGGELYKIYDEKRKYITYENINENIIQAIISSEDKRFWENPGYDLIGITRAVITGLNNGGHFQGTSGISQQLIKITYLNNNRTIDRKLKELYMSWNLNKILTKKDILELYLNKVFFGANSYGVEEASKTFFNKKAKEVNILEASILASLPKAPSSLSPYTHKDKLLGYPLVINKANLEKKSENIDKNIEDIIEDENIKILSQEIYKKNKKSMQKLETFFKNLTYIQGNNRNNLCGIEKDDIKLNNINKYGCTTITDDNFLSFLNSISIKNGSEIIEYKTGRKDYVLGRLLADRKITFNEYKQNIISSFGFEFKKYRDNIKYPYFVMYVKSYLEKKYGSEIFKKGGLKIYTTIDPILQDKAEEIVKKQVEYNTKRYNAKNASLISLDNKTGDILVMVGGVDYSDENNGGYNNMTLSPLQPGSTFKPLLYTLAIIKKGYWAKTILYDYRKVFPGNYYPRNSDNRYVGAITLSRALNHSKNTTAVKLFFTVGGEKIILNFIKKLGIHSPQDFKDDYKEKFGRDFYYKSPMALGTTPITGLELAGAYSVFANNGIKNEINCISKIVNTKGTIIFSSKENNYKKEQVISKIAAYKINSIISNHNDRPNYRNKYLTLSDKSELIEEKDEEGKIKPKKVKDYSKKIKVERPLAAKTGTSTKIQGGRIMVRNLWTVGYTPQITTVVWAGNTNGNGLPLNAYGLTGAAPIMKQFMDFAHINLPIERWEYPKD